MELYLDKLVRLNTQSDGRDKVARLIQYACRALWDGMRVRPWNSELIDKLKTLEYLLSSFRKLLRFGKCIDLMYAAQRTIHHTNVTIRLTLTLSKIAQALYLYADHILWLSRSGLAKSIDAKKWNDTANKYWFVSIVVNLCRDIYELSRLIDRTLNAGNGRNKQTLYRWIFDTNTNISTLSKRDLTKASHQMYAYTYENRAIFIDTTKNLCDIFIPLTALGYTKLKPRTVGLLGVISSIAAIIVLLQPAAKLQPS
ncbi:peroxisomal membrane protein 11B [Sitodiplosis mosellana]|uniref:peroxisomal membrane protein 11B n=1 Tax=Sitodiplosis mosellana TaxID=263140 RepID=UPI002444768F|nr:peroxisomal membrane protein 11B [Sitodiplosis mosellana]